MSAYKLTLTETETIINYSPAEKTASVYTCDTALTRKLDGLIASGNPDITLDCKNQYSKTYNVPKRWIKIKPLRKMSEKHRLQAIKNLTKNK